MQAASDRLILCRAAIEPYLILKSDHGTSAFSWQEHVVEQHAVFSGRLVRCSLVVPTTSQPQPFTWWHWQGPFAALPENFAEFLCFVGHNHNHVPWLFTSNIGLQGNIWNDGPLALGIAQHCHSFFPPTGGEAKLEVDVSTVVAGSRADNIDSLPPLFCSSVVWGCTIAAIQAKLSSQTSVHFNLDRLSLSAAVALTMWRAAFPGIDARLIFDVAPSAPQWKRLAQNLGMSYSPASLYKSNSHVSVAKMTDFIPARAVFLLANELKRRGSIIPEKLFNLVSINI